jgi:hypothetical protein
MPARKSRTLSRADFGQLMLATGLPVASSLFPDAWLLAISRASICVVGLPMRCRARTAQSVRPAGTRAKASAPQLSRRSADLWSLRVLGSFPPGQAATASAAPRRLHDCSRHPIRFYPKRHLTSAYSRYTEIGWPHTWITRSAS